MTGHLDVRIHAVRDVNHALSGRLSRGPETFAVIKVEDAFKGRTKTTRIDKWTDELHSTEIEKANEIEITVYDKSGSYPTPVGMLWIRIADIVEEMRRKKLESELSGSQWVTAEQVGNGPGSMSGPGGMGSSFGAPSGASRAPGATVVTTVSHGSQGNPAVIDAWFALEPVGSIRLSISFGEYLSLMDSCANASSKTKNGPETV